MTTKSPIAMLVLASACAAAFAAENPNLAPQAEITTSAATGRITVETRRYRARFEGGTLVYLHNKLRQQTLIDVALDPELPDAPRTALYVADQPKTEPYWIYPAAAGEPRAAVTITEQSRDGVTVTFKGLVAAPQGKEQRRFPEAELTLAVSVEPQSGHLLAKVSGRSPDTLVVGSALAYAGLTARSINYTTAASGLKTVVDLKSKEGRRPMVLEWANANMGKRMGLKGGLWPASVTVQASADDPSASFAIWAEDDVPRSKYLIEEGAGNAYATYEMPPYDHNRQAESVAWRINVFDGGWTAAAAPFADSLRRRGYADGRAPWREDISLIVFSNGNDKNYFESMADAFRPEVRPRIMIWMGQAWRTLKNTRDAQTHDAYYWDNKFSEEMAEAIRYATEAGFRVSGYTNPHYQWGHWNQVIDPEVRDIVKGFSALPIICPVGQETIGNTGHSLAYTPYREHMLRTYKHVFDNLDMSLYMDTMHQIPFDGRGTEVCGTSSYEGALQFFRAARALKRDQFIGMEFLTELGVMGLSADYALFYDLTWSQGWETHKAAHTHPIVSYLFRDTSVQVSQRVAPWSYGGPRSYHLAEQISERIGTIATTEWIFQNSSPENNLDTPEKRQWFAKIQLYVRRGLRPHFPEKWEDGVMSYLKAKDGATFKYLETDYGSKFVEFPAGGSQPVLHYARAWKTATVKAGNGYLHDWIGVADSGDFIGLDNAVRGYCLFSQPDASAAHLRLNAVPENLVIIAAKVEVDLAVVEVGPRERTQEKPAILGNVEGTAGKPITPITGTIGIVTDKPLVRIASAHQPAPVLKPLGQVDGQYRYELTGAFWGELAFVWREGVYAPFEPSDDYEVPVNATPPARPGEFLVELQPFDHRWNGEIGGPRNPRPGTVYTLRAKLESTDGKPGSVALFLTQPATQGPDLFAEPWAHNLKLDPPEAGELVIAGVRVPGKNPQNSPLALRSYPTGAQNVRLAAVSPVRFVRPMLGISDQRPIVLDRVARGQIAVSPARRVFNAQTEAPAAQGQTFATVLYGVANVATPNPGRPDMQEIDQVGIVLTGPHADQFALVGDHRADDGGLKLLGRDGAPGLRGGAAPESVNFAVRFNGAAEPGLYTATLRIVTQAGNLGVCSAGNPGEPLRKLFYLDIPVQATVE